MSRVSSVSIATGYGLDGLVFEFEWERDSLHKSRSSLRHTTPPKLWVPGFFQGVQRPGRGVDNTLTSSVEVKAK